MSKKEACETIKVVIRFKGCEDLDEKEKKDWIFNKDKKGLKAPNVDGKTAEENTKYTFDHILVEVT